MITGTSVDITVGFSVVLWPGTPAVYDPFFGYEIWPAIPRDVETEYAHFHLGDVSPPPVVAQVIVPAPPPKPAPLAGIIIDNNHNNANALELYLGQDVGNRKNSVGTPIGPQAAENYSLTRVAGDPNSTFGQTILVTALNLKPQEYDNVTEILVNNTLSGNDTIAIDNGISVPVYMTLGTGNNTISTGAGSATITISGAGNNRITTGNYASISVSAAGSGANQITTGTNASINILAAGSGNNQFTAGASANVTVGGTEVNTVNLSGGGTATTVNITGTGNNTVNVTDGSPTITVASTATGANTLSVNTASASTFNVNGGGNNSINASGPEAQPSPSKATAPITSQSAPARRRSPCLATATTRSRPAALQAER